MIYKSFLVERNLKIIKSELILFYGENLGMQNDFKNTIKKKNPGANIIKFNQEDIIKNINTFFKELFNFSLFEEKKIFFLDDVNDKILPVIEEIEKKIDKKIFTFFQAF